MKALTLTQPWATLIAIGAKHIETRSWATTYRGPLAIHAARGLPPSWRPFTHWAFRDAFNGLLPSQSFGPGEDDWTPDIAKLPIGAVVATCRLVNIVPILGCPKGPCLQLDEEWGPELVPERERAFGDYNPFRSAWLLDDVEPVDPPVPAMGHLRLWEWSA